MYKQQWDDDMQSMTPTPDDETFQHMQQRHMMQQPMAHQPMMHQPMVQQPMMQQPMMQQPMMQQPMMQPPMMQQPMMQQPMMQPPPFFYAPQPQMQQQFPHIPGMLPLEQSYIENILRLNRGKAARVYMTFENNPEWPARVFTGHVEEAGRDHIILHDDINDNYYLLLMVNLDYVEFEEPIDYFYPYDTTIPLAQYAPREEEEEQESE